MISQIAYWFVLISLSILLLLIVLNVVYSRADKKRNKGICKSTKKLMEKDGKRK